MTAVYGERANFTVLRSLFCHDQAFHVAESLPVFRFSSAIHSGSKLGWPYHRACIGYGEVRCSFGGKGGRAFQPFGQRVLRRKPIPGDTSQPRSNVLAVCRAMLDQTRGMKLLGLYTASNTYTLSFGKCNRRLCIRNRWLRRLPHLSTTNS